MKKILLFSLMCFGLNAQNHSTPIVTLTSNMTVQLTTNPTTVTMTLTGPDDRWFACGFGPSVVSGFFMGSGDVVVYTDGTLTDRYYAGTSIPPLDTSMGGTQNWTVISNTVSGTTRTIVATRNLNTGDSKDEVLTNGVSTINFAWARANGQFPNIGSYHGNTNRGFATANLVLSTDNFYLSGFKMYPNPADELLALELPQNFTSVTAEIIDLTGKIVATKVVSSLDNKIDVSQLQTGNYIMRVSSEDKQFSTNLIIE